MPKHPSRLHRRSSPVGFCIDGDDIDDDNITACSNEDEMNSVEARRRDEAQPSRRSDYTLGLLLMAVIVSLAKSSSLSNWFWFPSASTNQKRPPPTFGDEPRSLIYGPSKSDGSLCENLPPVKFITIRGERHSTTNLFRRVTDMNGRFKEQCGMFNKYIKRCDEVVGWKHGFLDPKRDVVEENVVVAVLVRDTFSWLVSMFNEPYNMVRSKKLFSLTKFILSHSTYYWIILSSQVMEKGTDNFGIFLRSNYTANECEVGDYYDGCSYPVESAENLIQASDTFLTLCFI